MKKERIPEWKKRGIRKALLEGMWPNGDPVSDFYISIEFDVTQSSVGRIHRAMSKEDREIIDERWRDNASYRDGVKL